MAPMKQPRDTTARNRDKPTKRRRRIADASLYYNRVGIICGEDCENDLAPMTETVGVNRSNPKREQKLRHDVTQDIEMDAVASDGSDGDWNEDREKRSSGNKTGRVNKLKTKKVPSKQVKEIPLKVGVEKAKRYLYEALDFGLQSGYLKLKDQKGKNLRVSSDLLLSAQPLQRITSGGMERRQRKSGRQQQLRDSQDSTMMELRDNDGDIEEAKRHRRGSKKHRSRSRSKRGGKRRHGKSRSRSRSKRRHGRRHMGRSRSLNADQDRAKQAKAEGAEEQDDMGENTQETTNSCNDDDNEDSKSTKSVKSSKSSPNNDSQTTNEDKKSNVDDDASNDEDHSDDDDKK